MKFPRFEKAVKDRGLKYFREGKAKNLVIEGKQIKATVLGTRRYRVCLDLKAGEGKCTCSYDRNCKHMVAAIQAYKKGKEVTSTDTVERKLTQKSKKDLIALILKMLRSEPRLKMHLNPSRTAITELHPGEDADSLADDVDALLERIMSEGKKIENLMLLFRKCFEIYGQYGGIEPLEGSMFDILRAISDEAKTRSPGKRQAILQEIVDMTEDFDFFWDSIDDEGAKVRYPSYYRR